MYCKNTSFLSICQICSCRLPPNISSSFSVIPMPQHHTSSGVMERTRLRPPHSYVVIMHNDDETTMDFVVNMLMQIFRLTHNESMKVMLKVHKEGQCEVKTYRSIWLEPLCAVPNEPPKPKVFRLISASNLLLKTNPQSVIRLL